MKTAPPHNLWTVARVHVHDLPEIQRTELIRWVIQVSGLPATQVNDHVRPDVVVSQLENDGSYRLHISRYVCDQQGRAIIDHAAQQVQIEPLVFTITDFPAWLPEASQQQGDS